MYSLNIIIPIVSICKISELKRHCMCNINSPTDIEDEAGHNNIHNIY